MKTSRSRLAWIGMLTLGGGIATAQDHSMSCDAHAAHTAGEQSPQSEHHAKVNERGDHEMGFDHAKTTHHFLLARDGGSIQVTANEASDQESLSQIRDHLTHITRMFADGNFQVPMLIHDRIPPGVDDMTRLKAKIEWKLEEIPLGARVVAHSKDSEAVAAIHEFLRFQIEDHRTGDPGTVPPASDDRHGT